MAFHHSIVSNVPNNLIFSAHNLESSNSLNCILVSPLNAAEGEFNCLNGDICSGTVQEVGDSVRMSGNCQKFGKALLVIPSFTRGTLEDVMSKTSGKTSELLYDLAFNPKEQPAIKSQETNNAVVSEVNNADQGTTSPLDELMSEAEDLCIELGFEEASDKLSTCILKTMKKLY